MGVGLSDVEGKHLGNVEDDIYNRLFFSDPLSFCLLLRSERCYDSPTLKYTSHFLYHTQLRRERYIGTFNVAKMSF